ncbi:MAG: hypothetical protein ACYTGL_20070 [Planctomycetota bacterium]|jgi:hypothetical protein
MNRLRTVCLVAVALATWHSSIHAADGDTVLRVVFFTPSDVEPPEGVRERLKEYVDYSQAFFAKWMKHWNYDCETVLPVNRDADGYPGILYVRGRHTEASGKYRTVGFEPEVVRTACREYDIDPKGQVWWIFTYKGPQRQGFRGGGNAKRGGTATSIYSPQRQGHLRVGNELGGREAGGLQAKAGIHELGHALGLPHIGPRQEDGLGNSLMGPTTPTYHKRFPGEERVYLSEAAAAMLWRHPLFTGSTKGRDVTPALSFSDVHISHDTERDQVLLTGKVDSDLEPHSVVVALESAVTRAGYWRKTYVGRVEKDRTFRVSIDALRQADGHFRIVCCFENGAIIGQSKGRGLETGFVRKYRFSDGSFIFDDSWEERGVR